MSNDENLIKSLKQIKSLSSLSNRLLESPAIIVSQMGDIHAIADELISLIEFKQLVEKEQISR